MTATNINIEQFIRVLSALKREGHKLIDLDMLPDEDNSAMNKLVIHPVRSKDSEEEEEDSDPRKGEKEDPIKNPNINRNNNDIFDYSQYFGL